MSPRPRLGNIVLIPTCRELILSFVRETELTMSKLTLLEIALVQSPLTRLNAQVQIPAHVKDDIWDSLAFHMSLRIVSELIFLRAEQTSFPCPPTVEELVAMKYYGKGIGWGITAEYPIPSNTVIFSYLGEVISSSEARRRHEENRLCKVKPSP